MCYRRAMVDIMDASGNKGAWGVYAAMLGPAAALTGPAARGDEATLSAHLDAIGRQAPRELVAYEAMLVEARRLAAMGDDA